MHRQIHHHLEALQESEERSAHQLAPPKRVCAIIAVWHEVRERGEGVCDAIDVITTTRFAHSFL